MVDTSLNRLYEAIGGLTAEVRRLRRDVQEDRSTSAAHRQGVREELSNLVIRQAHIESDMLSLKNKVEGMEKVTVEVTTLRTKAAGAGTLGRGLLRLGGWLLSAAGGFATAWTLLTGRPPP